MTYLSHARLASAWLVENCNTLNGAVDEPAMLSWPDSDIIHKFDDHFESGGNWDGVRDWLLFNCSSESCLREFDDACKINEWRVNIALQAQDYIENNCI
jgi:hypothetical protein